VRNLAFDLQKNKSLREGGLFQPFKLVRLWDMLEFYAFGFVSTFNFLIGLREPFDGIEPFLTQVRPQLEEFRKTLLGMNLENSAAKLESMLYTLDHLGKWDEPEWGHDFKELAERITDEFRTKLIYMVPYSKADYFSDSTKPFPQGVRNNFPSAVYDMDEASKCFALDRHTACVFHLMRILEIGLNILGKDLGVTVAESWGAALRDIRAEILSRNKGTHGPEWKTDHEPFYSDAASSFHLFKNAWRNHIMHGKENYNEEQARRIFDNVGAFMSHLATRLSELESEKRIDS
jgi:hypothetical protein